MLHPRGTPPPPCPACPRFASPIVPGTKSLYCVVPCVLADSDRGLMRPRVQRQASCCFGCSAALVCCRCRLRPKAGAAQVSCTWSCQGVQTRTLFSIRLPRLPTWEPRALVKVTCVWLKGQCDHLVTRELRIVRGMLASPTAYSTASHDPAITPDSGVRSHTSVPAHHIGHAFSVLLLSFRHQRPDCLVRAQFRRGHQRSRL